jgi:serine/threonine protein kinase
MSERQPIESAARERWQRIEALFDAVIDLPPSEREAYLREHCGADDALRIEILRLLAQGESPHSVLDGPAGVIAALLEHADDATAAPPAFPERIGPYRVVRELGQGGMGAVYLGERDDGEFRQTVALKLVRTGLHHDPRILRRFREERQILASLRARRVACG